MINSSCMLRYVAPFAVFSFFSWVQSFGSGPSLFGLYALKILVTAIVFFYFFKGSGREIEGGLNGSAVFLGLVTLGIWIIFFEIWPVKTNVIFDPDVFKSLGIRVGAIFLRCLGSCLLIPLIEEVFWRSFLMRCMISGDFLSVRLGTYTPLSFWVSVISFALVHPFSQWGLAGLTGALYGLYLIKTKNLVGCILAHATTNLGLGIYIIVTGHWELWT